MSNKNNNISAEYANNINNKTRKITPDRLIKQNLSFFMYWSKGDHQTNQNGSFFSNDHDKIVCRHLAYAHLMRKELALKNYHEEFKKPHLIPFLSKNKFDEEKIEYAAKSYHLITINNLGNALSNLAGALKENTEIGTLFYTENHAMSIKIKNKGKEGIIVQFYDPNTTFAHQQVIFPDIESISSLQLSDLLDESRMRLYFSRFNGLLAVYQQSDSIPLLSNTINEDVLPSEQLYFGLKLGYTSWVIDAANKILTTNFNNQEKKALLLCKDPFGNSGLFMALKNGYYEAVQCYMELILHSKLENKTKYTLLACQGDGDNETPGLFMALMFGHHKAIVNYIHAVLESQLLPEEKVTLLACNDVNSVPGLFMAFVDGYHESIETYVKLILDSNLGNEEKKNLLMCRNDDEMPGFLIGLLNDGSHEAEIKYIKLICESTLDFEQKNSLLFMNNEESLFSSFLENKDYIGLFNHLSKIATTGDDMDRFYGSTTAIQYEAIIPEHLSARA